MKPSNPETGEIAGLALLRVPFDANQISKLPKPTISNDEWKKLPKADCKECGGYHATSKTIHLSYVGHAALTDRLLDADPSWTWEPVSMGQDGQPMLDSNGGMWIRLTVCGVTRLGYGDAQGKAGGNAVKERIGDALRNAAMRFGAALDLWHKGDLHGDEEEPPVKKDPALPSGPISANAGAKDNVSPEQAERVRIIASKCLDWLNATPSSVADAAAVADEAEMDTEEALYFWTFFDSKQRSAMKAEAAARRKRATKEPEPSQA